MNEYPFTVITNPVNPPEYKILKGEPTFSGSNVLTGMIEDVSWGFVIAENKVDR